MKNAAADAKLASAHSKTTMRDARKDEHRAHNRAIRRAGKADCRAAR